MRSTVFSIVGASISGDKGAEARLSATVAQLRRRVPGARFHVFTPHAEDDARLLSEPSVTLWPAGPARTATAILPGSLALEAARRLGLRRVPRFVPGSARALAGSVAVLDLSEASFADGRVRHLPADVLALLPAGVAGVPVVKLSQTLGPFEDVAARAAGRRWLPRCRKTFARDDECREALLGIGVPEERLGTSADVAFLHEPEEALGCVNLVAASEVRDAVAAERKAGRKVVAISPGREAGGGARRRREHAEELAGLAAAVVDSGRSVLLLPAACRDDRRGDVRDNDLPLIEDVASLTAGMGHVHAVAFELDTAGIKEMLAGCDAAIAFRLSTAIAAIATRTPVAAVCPEPSCRHVMERFGLGGYVAGPEERGSGTVLAMLDALEADRTRLRRSVAQRLRRVRESSAGQIEYVAGLAAERPRAT